MGTSWPESSSSDRKKAIQELIQGREVANRLRSVILAEPFGGGGGAGDSTPAAAEDLVIKILGSFTETISILNRSPAGEVYDQIPANTCVSSPCWDGRKSEDSEESSKTSALKDRRGCYKRRKTSQTWIRTTSTLIDDGHAWRKYGQKVILNAKHPRNYFRCTHKFDQGCQATKQVQRTEDDPPLYRTTYHGHHTCSNLLKAPQILLDTTTPRGDSSVLLSFGSTNPNNQLQLQEPYFPTMPLIKQEYFKEDNKPSTLSLNNHSNNNNQSSSSDYLLSSDLTTFESSGPMTVLSSGSDHGDVISSSGVYSCTESTRDSLGDMDIMVGGVDYFDDVLQFDF